MKDDANILELMFGQVKQILVKMLQEERQIYLEEHPETKGNGYYDRDLQLPFGALEDLRVPRSRDGGFKSQLLPHRRCSVEETHECIRAMLVAGCRPARLGKYSNSCFRCTCRPPHPLD